jgi:hypothetical protein
MPRFQVSWTEEQWYSSEVEAESHEQAIEMVFSGDFDWPEPHGFEIQDTVDCEELNG